MSDGLAWMAQAFDAYCVTFVRGVDIVELARRMGAGPGDLRPDVTVEEAFALAMNECPVALVGVCGEWAFALELWSDAATDTPTLPRLSQDGEAVVLLSSTGPRRFLHGAGGQVLADFEPGVSADEMAGAAPGRLREALLAGGFFTAEGLAELGEGSREEWMLRSAETVFGLSLPRRQLEDGASTAVMLP
ncbi:DUF6461 domain-containing protein [Streptomyces sp. NPDC059070]|uniref:DUF6461 domain-containing protein n=1 Tax=unclassified Streptomyces TaxID=2593676 RepID=UPI0034E2CF04